MGPTHMPLHYRLPLGCFLDTQACLCACAGGSAWTSPPAGDSAAGSSARQARLLLVSWPTLCLPLPNNSDILVNVDCFGPLPPTPRGNAYTLFFTDLFSRHADMCATTEAQLFASGTADVLVERYIPLRRWPVTLISANVLQVCSKLPYPNTAASASTKLSQASAPRVPTTMPSASTIPWPSCSPWSATINKLAWTFSSHRSRKHTTNP